MNETRINIEEELNNLEDEDNQEDINKELDGGWTKKKQLAIQNWIGYLEYIQLIVYFHMFQLKKVENFWSWLIIVLSAITSSISIIQFDRDREDIVLAVNVFVSVFTIFTTLIASWMKKQNYVQRIGDLEKYLQSLNILIAELKGQVKLGPDDRIPWKEFLERYRDKMNEFESSAPLISPENWKETNYTLTKYYPELVKDTYPWNEDKSWGDNILKTYKKVKYRSVYNKICYCYYCSKIEDEQAREEESDNCNENKKSKISEI